MPYNPVFLGTVPNDGTGDSPRLGGQKINGMLQEIFNWTADDIPFSSGAGLLATDVAEALDELATMIGGFADTELSNLSDAATARGNLGLGNSATLDTGTSAGTVATGNHTHTASQVGLGNVTNDAQLKIAANLSDLNNAVTARGNLGLGNVATLNLGTTAGTVSEGDHTHTASQVGLGNVTNDAQLKIASNLSDLNNAATARGNLGLGDSATLNVGTGAGTVAAGNHNHDGTYLSLSGGTMTGTVRTTVYDNGNSGTSKTLSLANGNYQQIVWNGNCTITLTPGTGAGQINLAALMDGSLRTVTWPVGVVWHTNGGSAPELTGPGDWDMIILYWDGTNWHGAIV